MHALKRLWPDALVIIGACLLVYGFAGFNGTTGLFDGDGWSFGFGHNDRETMTAGAGMVAVGLLAIRRAAPRHE